MPTRVTFTGPARLTTRLFAFLIDGLIMFAISVGVYLCSALFGAWTLDAEWAREYSLDPSGWPNVPPLHVNINLIAVTSVAIAVAMVVFAVASWVRLGGLPGQRAMGLRVVDFDTGKFLSWTAATRRALVVFGAAGGVMSLYALLNFERLAEFPVGDTSSQLVSPDGPLAKWSDLIGLGIFLGTVWLAVAAVTCSTNSTRRGIHDRIGGSIVIAIRKWPVAWPAPGTYPNSTPYPGPVAPYGGPGSYPPPSGWPGVGPAPGWTPPGTWTPPGQESPVNWAPPGWTPPGPSATTPSGAGPTSPGSEPAPAAPPWKREAEAEPKSLANRESATVTRRVVAYSIDSLIVLLLFSAVFAALSPDTSLSTNAISERVSIFAGLAGGAIQMVYFVLGWTFWRATIGQRVAGIAVVCESGGTAMGAMDALVRWAVIQGPFALATIVPLAISPLVVLVAAGWSSYLLYSTQSDAGHQGLHDHFLRTRVVAV